MKQHVEAWARFCATHKYSVRMTIEQAIARKRAVLSCISQGVRCEVCGGWLQVGYKTQKPYDNLRTYTTGYIHTTPEWCERATATERVTLQWEAHLEAHKQAVHDAFDRVDRERHDGAQFDNLLLAVSARIALAWLDLGSMPQGETE